MENQTNGNRQHPKIRTERRTVRPPESGTLNTTRVPEQKQGARAKGTGATARGYSYKWEKARKRFLSEHPLCCYCEREGRITAASVVDHIEPHRGDKSLFWNESNWQPLCKPCHDSVKAREEGRGGSKV